MQFLILYARQSNLLIQKIARFRLIHSFQPNAHSSFLSLPHPALLHRPQTKIGHKPSYEQRLPVSAPGGKKSWKGDNKGKGKYGAAGGSVGPGDVQVKLILDPKAFQSPGTVGR